MSRPMTEDRLAELMVKAADGLASPAERAELLEHLAEHPELRDELAVHTGLSTVTRDWMASVHLDAAEDRHTASPGARMELLVGTLLLVGALAVLGGFGLSELFLDPEAPLGLKVGMGLLAGSGGVFLVAAVRWRLATAPHDPYTEVLR